MVIFDPIFGHFLTPLRVSKMTTFWPKSGFLTQISHMFMRVICHTRFPWEMTYLSHFTGFRPSKSAIFGKKGVFSVVFLHIPIFLIGLMYFTWREVRNHKNHKKWRFLSYFQFWAGFTCCDLEPFSNTRIHTNLLKNHFFRTKFSFFSRQKSCSGKSSTAHDHFYSGSI